ncbi:subtilisin-like protein [Hyaloscypha hepaticicola]|uniref:Subtilisin-like protein n=1 Tax=Hyaloscypha hepaticicola TaxID=2082293 RepID=A0A2J6PDE6_9HELO|nr:subtilisin-like protein [Hyaloscypha hepaticicola]
MDLGTAPNHRAICLSTTQIMSTQGSLSGLETFDNLNLEYENASHTTYSRKPALQKVPLCFDISPRIIQLARSGFKGLFSVSDMLCYRPDGSFAAVFMIFSHLQLSYAGFSSAALKLAIGLVYPQQVTNYQVGDLIEGGALTTSYCTYDGGGPRQSDNLFSVDPQYPDPLPGRYKSKDCGTLKSTHVLSFSDSVDEALFPPSAMIRECHEYMKLGLQGVTIIVSSGDSGVAGREGGCCINPGYAPSADGSIISLYINSTTGFPATTGKTFVPHFPDSCPYLTSVGATMIKPNSSVKTPEQAAKKLGPVPFYSGGGFSNHLPPYTPAQYNNTRRVRGIPDVSANGLNVLIAVGGKWVLSGGTSTSAPIVGSIITLINEQRIKAGKGPSKEEKPGCGTNGFDAVEGWDPVTGLRTLDLEKLLRVWMALP